MTRREWLAILLALVVAGLWLHPYRAQQASRYALTAAIAERGTVVLDDYEHVLGIDRAVRDGRVYSDKAPGQPVLAVPVYLAYRAVGGESAEVLRIDENLGLWWVTLWSSVLPLGALTILMQRYLRRKGHSSVAWPVALALTYGTLLLPFGGLLFGHVLAALALFSFLFLVDRDDPRPVHLVGGGFAAGLAVAVEYTAILGVIPIGLWMLLRHRSRAAWVAAGAVPLATLLMVYNAVAFGGPAVLSYQFSAFSSVTDIARPTLGMFALPALENLWAMVAAPRGLLLATPVALLALAGLPQVWKKDRARGAALAAAVLALLAVVAFWGNPWGGASPGPRYFVPAIPLLALPLAHMWMRARLLSVGVSVVGVLTMFLAVSTEPLVPVDGTGGLGEWARLFIAGDVAPSLFGAGRWFAVVCALIGSTVASMILRSSDTGGNDLAVGGSR